MKEPDIPVFCKDCKFLVPDTIPTVTTIGFWCSKTQYFDLVTGSIGFLSCKVSRGNDKYCGESGKWFRRAD